MLVTGNKSLAQIWVFSRGIVPTSRESARCVAPQIVYPKLSGTFPLPFFVAPYRRPGFLVNNPGYASRNIKIQAIRINLSFFPFNNQ